MGPENPLYWGFNFSPKFAPFFAPDTTTVTDTIVGNNIQQGDGPIERHVLEQVGSYGYQINRIVDVLMILLQQAAAHDGLPSDLKLGKLDFSHVPAGEEARNSIKDFLEMAAAAAKASEEYKEQGTNLAVERLMVRMKRLKKTDKALYDDFKDKIESGLRE